MTYSAATVAARLEGGPSEEFLRKQNLPPQQVYLDTPAGEVVRDSESLDADLSAGMETVPEVEEFEESDEIKRARDRHPAAQDVETALQLHEENVLASRMQRWHGQERWAAEFEEPRMGRILHMYDFVRILGSVGVELKLNEWARLGRIGVNALVCEGCAQGPWAGCTEVCPALEYLHVPPEKGKSILWSVQRGGTRKLVWKTVTTLHNGRSPEYSVMRFNGYEVPTNEKFRGWRTALLTLISAGVVSKGQALRAFGEASGEVADFYLKQLAEVNHE